MENYAFYRKITPTFLTMFSCVNRTALTCVRIDSIYAGAIVEARKICTVIHIWNDK